MLQLNHAGNAVEGGSQLVADTGQELVLESQGFLKRFNLLT